MRFAEELVEVDSLDVRAPSRKPTKREVEMAATLVESLHDDFAPEAFHDDYRERVLELIEAKARGEEPELPVPAEEAGGMDLAAALEASLGHSGKAAKRTGKRSSGKATGSRKRTSKAKS
jgi:DNA end-binding protein Ku